MFQSCCLSAGESLRHCWRVSSHCCCFWLPSGWSLAGQLFEGFNGILKQALASGSEQGESGRLGHKQAVGASVSGFFQVGHVLSTEQLAQTTTDLGSQFAPGGWESALKGGGPNRRPLLHAIFLPDFGKVGKGQDTAEVLVAPLDTASADEAAHGLFADGGMVQEIGECHGLGQGDRDPKGCRNGFEFREGEKAKAAEVEVTLGGDKADVFASEIGFGFRAGEKFDKPFGGARRMEADNREFIRRSAVVSRLAPLAFGAELPFASEEAVSDGFSGVDRLNAGREESVHILGADLHLRFIAEEIVTCGEAADNNDVLVEVIGNGVGDLFEDGAG